MQFLNPLALAGLATVLIPLAIHLLHRGKPREVPFSNLAFLHELHESRMRSVQLRQWLVLLLRMLALACLALAFARPALQEGGSLLSGSRPTTAVVLIDQSYSTRFTPPGGRVFDHLLRRAEQVLALFDSGQDRLYLVPTPLQGNTVDGPLGTDAARQLVGERLPGEATTQLEPALRQAQAILDEHEVQARELFLLTDMAQPGWSEITRTISAEVSTFVIGPPPTPKMNRYASDVNLADWLAASGQKLSVQAVVGRWGGPDESEETAVHLYIDGERTQQRLVPLAAGGTASVDFSIAPRRSGQLTGFVEIETDRLPIDNRHYFTFSVPEQISVVIAGATPRDTYYPRRALTAAATGDPTLSVSSIGFEEMSTERLADADVLIVTHIETPSTQQVRVIRDFAAAGGGVLIVPGTGANATRLNRELLADLVPASLGNVSGRPGAAAFAHLDTTRAPTQLFKGLLSIPEDQPDFAAAFDISASQQLSVLARFDSGQPALVEGRSQNGHVLLWSTPFDLRWSDLPLRGLYVPLMQRMVRYLAQSTTRGPSYIVGDRAWRRLPGTGIATRVETETPSGRRLVVQSEALGTQRLWKVPELDEAGIWQMLVGGAVVDVFAVNLDTDEADLTPVLADEIQRRLGSHVRILQDGDSLPDVVNAARFGRELWREFLVLAVVLLMLELWLARAPSGRTWGRTWGRARDSIRA